MATVSKYFTKSGSKRWKVVVFGGRDPQTGKKKWIVRGGFKGPEGKKEATLTGARLELAINSGDYEDTRQQKPVLFRDVYAEWYGNYINTVRESTWSRTDGMFQNHILPAFGDKRVDTITTRDVQKVVKKWFEGTKANYKRWYNYVGSVMDYSLRQGYIKKNPCAAVVLPKHDDAAGDPFENFWTRDQMNHFFDCIDKKQDFDIFIMFRVLAFSGVRRGELLALTWQDVNFKDSSIRVNKTLTQGKKGRQIVQAPKTKAGRRTVPLDRETMAYLKQWRHVQQEQQLILGYNTLKPQQLVFANTRNGYHSLNTPGKRLKKIIRDNDLKPRITVHGFRHSFISNLLIAHVPITSVQRLVGHSDPTVILQTYAHVTQKEEREATATLADYMDI